LLVLNQKDFVTGIRTSQTLTAASSFFTNFENIKITLQKKLENGSWQIVSDLEAVTGSFHGICYDFYSSKQDPELWSEDFLKSFLKRFADSEICFFSTYACTGVLKRALAQHNFTVIKKPGFCQKRDSTLAYKFNAARENEAGGRNPY
jgi:hypothetical protein